MNMGYYSQVGLCVKQKDFEELKERFGTEYGYMLEKNFCDIITIEDSDYGNIIVCNWDSIKWYPYSFKEIVMVEDFLSELEERDEEFSFVRIGEEYGDIEIRDNYINGCCDRLHLYQGFEIY